MTRKVLILLAAGIATTLRVSTALGDTAPSVRVRYSDLNLAADAGVSRLYYRLGSAPRSVGGFATVHDVVDPARAARALDVAVATAGNPKLIALQTRVMPGRGPAAGPRLTSGAD